jgi:hypothetical protein
MAGKHLRNRNIAVLEDSTYDKINDEVDNANSVKDTAVSQEGELDGSVVTTESEIHNSVSTLTTEASVSMSTKQMQDLLSSAISTLRADIVSVTETKFQEVVKIIETNNLKFQAECSSLRANFLTITEQLDSKLQAATDNITARIQQENDKLTKELKQNMQIEVNKLNGEISTLRNDCENKFQEVTGTIGGINDVLHEKIDAHVVATRKVTDRISQELNVREGRMLEEIKGYKAKTENNLKELRQEYSQFKEQLDAGQVTWRNKAGGEIDMMKDNVKLVEERVAKLVEERVTESQVASQNSIREVNTEIKRLREHLAAKHATDQVISIQIPPVTEVNLGNSSQEGSEASNCASNYHMGNVNINNSTTSVCGDGTPQPRVNNNVETAIVNVPPEVFASNLHLNELTLPQFHDSSTQIVLHFLRDLDEYYQIKNIPESLKLPLAMRAVSDPIAKSWFSTVYHELKGYEQFKTLFTKFLWNSPTQSRIRCSIYQDKFAEHSGESMTSHYLRYANLAENLQPAMSEEDLVGALTSHYSISVQRSLISGNIKTTQDAITLLGKLDALETQGNYRNNRRDSETQDADRRPRYNQRDERADRNRREAVRVQQIQYEDDNYDRNRAYRSPHRNARRGRYNGWGEQERQRPNHMTSGGSASLNPAAQRFEPRTDEIRPNEPQQGTSNRDIGDILNH